MPLFLPHFNLQNYNTLASPVTAEWFVSVVNEEELLEALIFSREKKIPLLILGGGSNIVLREDFPGLVIHIQLSGKELVREDENHVYVSAAAGEDWNGFVEFCLAYHYWGIENLSLIPGSVGAAPIQNIGAYGVELKDIFSELCAIDIQSGLRVTFTRDACGFDYRESVFKHALKDRYVITSVTFKLNKKPNLAVHYPALQTALSVYTEEITPELISKVIGEIRRSKLPDPKVIPNVGSFFKNPIVPCTQLEKIKALYPNVVFFPSSPGSVKLAAGWLIEQAEWKGFSDDVEVYAQQALVLTNPKRLKADKVLFLAERICESVLLKFGVALEVEPRIYP